MKTLQFIELIIYLLIIHRTIKIFPIPLVKNLNIKNLIINIGPITNLTKKNPLNNINTNPSGLRTRHLLKYHRRITIK